MKRADIKPIPSTTGGTAEGEAFFGREDEFREFYAKLIKGNDSFIIHGPRRTGKSSFIKEYQNKYPKHPPIIYIYIQHCTNTYQLAKKIINRIAEVTKGKKNFLRSLIFKINGELNRLLKAMPKVNPLEKSFDEMLATITPALKEAGKAGYVIVLDEFADCILHMERNNKDLIEVKTCLMFFRATMQEGRCRMIFASSINFLDTIERMGFTDLITDVSSFTLKYLSHDETLRLFKGLLLFKDISLEDDCDEFILQKVGRGNHYHIQLFADRVSSVATKAADKVTLQQLTVFYEETIQTKDPGLVVFHTRIMNKDYFLPEEKTVAIKILAHLSQQAMCFKDLTPLVAKNKSLTKRVLDKLIDNAYLTQEQDQYLFFSPFLQDWWQKHYGHET